MKNVEVAELHSFIESKALFIDVREAYEQPKFQFPNHKEIPMSELGRRLEEIPREGDVLIYCHSGGRSANVVEGLELQCGYKNLLNVLGGALSLAAAFPELKK